ncbi:SigB/SigF/SigG family RNA polymerase sigma factor [Acetivibrio sp. MSJd-27]|uniref:SigB/SigF/SigG family RNA polymerase sigma factor n=1 Tax=Acetivibrio sp. MSJd-27 TaxID=2841523 RepID=UPI001C11D8D4|nr:SigB/SigF/SigG family RNA polymerase sigma factor [Acetivibrio sp. MSJd-27]MBU5450426.1 SigB/SigF/SigG family RNA polymerase sigma factor [Acetivibrio sp. MSJd-27]
MVHTIECGSPDMTELLRKAKDGNEAALECFLDCNTGLVCSIAKKFYNRGVDAEDIHQLGMMGLLKAVRKFDFSYEVKFSTYAVPMIMGEIKRFLRDDGTIKVSRSLKELAVRAKYAIEKMEKETGRHPTVYQLAEEMGVDAEELICALNAVEKPDSIDASVGDDESLRLIDKIEDKSLGTEEELIDKITLKEMIRELEKRERQIIILRYFQGKTQQVIASMLGISQVQVSRIEKKVLLKMREKLNGGR